MRPDRPDRPDYNVARWAGRYVGHGTPEGRRLVSTEEAERLDHKRYVDSLLSQGFTESDIDMFERQRARERRKRKALAMIPRYDNPDLGAYKR